MAMPYIAVSLAALLFWIILSDTLHELAHVALCRVLRCPVTGLKLPFLLLRKDGRKMLRFSLREQKHCTFRTDDPGKALWVTLSGPLANLLLGAVLLAFGLAEEPRLYLLPGGVYNFVMFAYNLLPVGGGDGALICKLLKER